MLPNTGSRQPAGPVAPAVTYLTLQANNPASWPLLFGVQAQVNAQNAAHFDLSIVYDPASGGVGVTLPVTVEQFTDLSLADAAAEVSPGSELITVESFAEAPDPSLSAFALMNFDPSTAVPSITLDGTFDEHHDTLETRARIFWRSGESDPVFVVEVESDGTATVRFGDDVKARHPDTGTVFTASYRIGNGTAGNVGADSLANVAVAHALIQACRNPLPAAGGTDPETNDQIRRRAPQAFLTQERAVTMADYEAVTEMNSQVDRAVATLRWTGSWYTVFIAVEPDGRREFDSRHSGRR